MERFFFISLKENFQDINTWLEALVTLGITTEFFQIIKEKDKDTKLYINGGDQWVPVVRIFNTDAYLYVGEKGNIVPLSERQHELLQKGVY